MLNETNNTKKYHWGNGSKALKKTKRGDYIVQTPDKDDTLLFTRRKTTTNALCMSDQIHHEAHSHRKYLPSPYKKNLL